MCRLTSLFETAGIINAGIIVVWIIAVWIIAVWIIGDYQGLHKLWKRHRSSITGKRAASGFRYMLVVFG